MFDYIISTNISMTIIYAKSDTLGLILALLEISIKNTCSLLCVLQTILLKY